MSARKLLRPLYVRFEPLRRIWRVALYLQFLQRKARSTLSSERHDLAAINEIVVERFKPQARLREASATLPDLDLVVEAESAPTLEGQLQALAAQGYPATKLHLFIPAATADIRATALRFQDAFASLNLLEQNDEHFWTALDRAIRAGRAPYCLILKTGGCLEPGALRSAAIAAVSDSDGASWELRCHPQEQSKLYDPVTLETSWSDHRCVLLRRTAYERSGGYEIRLEIGPADIELSYRLRSFGYRLRYLPWATYRTEVPPRRTTQGSCERLGTLCLQLRYGDTWTRTGALGQLLVLTQAMRCRAPKTTVDQEQWQRARQLLPQLLRDKGPHAAVFPMSWNGQGLLRDCATLDGFVAPPMQDAPLVSVIVRSYHGREALLRQAMQSVFNQTYPRVELLVVQDGGDSLDGLVSGMASAAPHTQVRFIANAKLGRSAAGNRALAEARGQFLMFLDDDDLLFADHIESLAMPLLADASLAASYSLPFEVLTEMNVEQRSYTEVLYQTPELFQQPWDYEVLLDHNFIAIQSILFRRELYETRGGFDTELDQLEDWNLWLRYGYDRLFKFVPKTTSLFRSPASYKVRSRRHVLLNDAYVIAKSRARTETSRYSNY